MSLGVLWYSQYSADSDPQSTGWISTSDHENVPLLNSVTRHWQKSGCNVKLIYFFNIFIEPFAIFYKVINLHVNTVNIKNFVFKNLF